MSEKSQTPNALAMTVARKILGALVRNAVRGDGVLTDVSLAKEIETLIAGEVSRVREKADKYLAALDACMPDVPGEPCPTCDVPSPDPRTGLHSVQSTRVGMMAQAWFRHVAVNDSWRVKCSRCGDYHYKDVRVEHWPKTGSEYFSKCGPVGEMYYQQRKPLEWKECTNDNAPHDELPA